MDADPRDVRTMQSVQPAAPPTPSRRLTVLAVVLVAAAGLCGSPSTAQDLNNAPVILSGKYSDLHPEQKRLVDNWFHRFSEVVDKDVPAEEGYDNVPLSMKTTFSAITHALLRTTLTDSSGSSLGDSAMTLVDRIDEVLGKVSDARGDKQFRIYVSLKEGGLEILEKSQEFGRGADNTVYHKGYPICFRSRGGTPSIQVSVTKDGKRADIDVDDRSSKFPVALVNGHLTASNSDIRSGNNDDRHNNRWAGVSNWWHSLLGLPLSGSEREEEAPVLPREPKIKDKAPPADAVQDFLHSWLVDQKPGEAVAYISDAALPCMELEQGGTIDRGVARFKMLMGLHQINQQIGKITDLSEAVVAVPIKDPRGHALEQPYKSQFALYDVREDLAEEFMCNNRLDPSRASDKAAHSKAFGKYVGAVFYLNSPGVKGDTVATLWTRENRYWKLISYATEPEVDTNRSARLPVAPIETPAIAYDPGDKQMIQAAKDFFNKWFIRRRVDEAFRYLSPRSYACANLYRNDEVPLTRAATEAGQLIEIGMVQIANSVKPAGKLEKAIVAPEVFPPRRQAGHSRGFCRVRDGCHSRLDGRPVRLFKVCTG
jgi:hypothetical protein